MPATTIPPGPKGRWLTGHLREFRAGSLDFITRVARQYGDFVPLRFGFRNVLLVSDPNAIEEVLLTKSRDFVKHFGLQLTRQLLGNGLLNSEGDFWLRQRRLAQPAFHRARINAYGRDMIDLTRDAIAGWRAGDRRDLVTEMMTLTLRIAAKTLFGAEETGDAATIRDSLAKAVHHFNQRFGSLIRFPPSWPTPLNRKMRRNNATLNAIIYRYIERRRREPHAGKTDLLSLLLHARDEVGDGTGMTDAQLRDEVMTLFLAGQETTALALSWAWYLLLDRPDVEEKLLAELHEVLGNRELTVADVPNLKYTEAIILETMRLYPPAYLLGREAIHDVEIGGYRIPRGVTLFMCQWIVHRDPRWWTDPDTFRPERWLDGSTKNLPKYAYFPFGGGPRICIGNTFAMMETVLILALLARAFHFERVDRGTIAPLPSITLRPTRPIAVTLHAR